MITVTDWVTSFVTVTKTHTRVVSVDPHSPTSIRQLPVSVSFTDPMRAR